MDTKFSDLTLIGKLLLIPTFAIIFAIAWFGPRLVDWLYPGVVNTRLMGIVIVVMGLGAAGWFFALSSVLLGASKLRVLHPEKVRVWIGPHLKTLIGDTSLTSFLLNIPDGLNRVELFDLEALVFRRGNGYYFGTIMDFDKSRIKSIIDEMNTEWPRSRPFNEHAPGYRVASREANIKEGIKPDRNRAADCWYPFGDRVLRRLVALLLK
jgi:hypothetical protein